MTDITKTITFIEFDIPRLKAGEYTITAAQKVNQGDPGTFSATRSFAVAGPRFTLGGDEIAAWFPPPLANGEFDGVFPHVVLKRPVLPWLRTSVESEINAPWLAVLTLQDGEVPVPDGQPGPAAAMTAADLAPLGTPMSIAGAAPITAKGRLPAGYLSYPGIAALDYGEDPSDPVNVIDLPVALFGRIAPTQGDLPMLAHLRRTDTYDSVDSTDTILTRSVVLGNRMGAANSNAFAMLVSLENMGPYLPDDTGAPSPNIPAGTTHVRLTVLSSWRFFVNDLDETLETLLESLDRADHLSTLRIAAPAVAADDVRQALQTEASHLSIAAADVLVADALAAGYIPLDHRLRLSGNTVSWYRGALLPFLATAPTIALPVAGPDALLRYDPFAGMFDTSLAAAWQLGQLLGLANTAYATALYAWKHQVTRAEAIAAEQAVFTAALVPDGPEADATAPLASFLARRAASIVDPPAIPDVVAQFLGGLRLLKTIPFRYLVPDERMLPPESLRIFSVDPNWIEALIDGAFSIGRNASADVVRDAALTGPMRHASAAHARSARRNDRPVHAALKAMPAAPTLTTVTGLLIRSQAVRNWPKLQIDGYSTQDDSKDPDVAKLRMEHLSPDVLLCLFDGPVAMIAIHEPPEQLHSGVEFDDQGIASTTLREVTGSEPGHQYPVDPKGGPPTATVPLRADGLTMQALPAAKSIQTKLNTDFGQGVDPITANEFALEMVKGVVRVEYLVGAA